jgi:hypothetical protein
MITANLMTGVDIAWTTSHGGTINPSGRNGQHACERRKRRKVELNNISINDGYGG